MDGRSPERGSSRGPETGAAPQTRKTRRELRAEREAAERAATGEQPTRPGQPSAPGPPGRQPETGSGPAERSGSWFDQPGVGQSRRNPRGEGAGYSGRPGPAGHTGSFSLPEQEAPSGPFDLPGPPADRSGAADRTEATGAKRPGLHDRPGLMDRPSLKDRPSLRDRGGLKNRSGPGQPPARQAPRPWDEPEEQRPPERTQDRPERGPLDERLPARPTPFGGLSMRDDSMRNGEPDLPRQGADRRPPIREAATRSVGVPPKSARPQPGASRRDRSDRLRPSADEEQDEFEDYEEEDFEDFEDEEHEPEPHRPVDPRKRRRTAIWLFSIAVLLGLWAVTMFVDSASPLITLPAALMPLVTICALPVIAIGVGSKHFVSTGIAALAALLPWAMVAGYASSRDAPAGKLSTVRVLTVEGAHGRADADAIADAAKDYAADVVIITGLNTTLAHDLTVAGLDKQAPAQGIVQVQGAGSNGIGIWSRLAVQDLTELKEFAKPAASAVLEAGTARVGVTIAQMPGSTLLPGKGWRADLDRLAQQRVAGAETGSFLVGDLNAAPWQPAFRALEKAGWEDAADVAGKGLRPTWPAWSPLPVTPADHLLVDKGIGVTSTATVDITGSPHRALVVSLEVPTG